MTAMETIRVHLAYPVTHVKEPIIYHLVTDYHLIPDIRQANIDLNFGGTLGLLLQGTRADLDAGMEFLRSLNIIVTEV